MTKREWQIEMANRFAKRDNVNIEELDTRSYLLGRYDSTKTLTDEEIRKAVEAEREACAKLCEEQMQGKASWIEGARACKAAIQARGQA